MQVLDKFTYLGSTPPRAVHIDDEVTAKTAKASVALADFLQMSGSGMESDLDTKLKVYKAVVLTTLLYTCETRTVYQRHAKRLNHSHLKAKIRNSSNQNPNPALKTK